MEFQSQLWSDEPRALPLRYWPGVALDAALHSLAGDPAQPGFWSWSRWWRYSRAWRKHGVVRDIFRNLEYQFAEWAGDVQPGHKIADIGAGHTLFAPLLAQRVGFDLTSIDYDAYCEEFQNALFERLGLKNARMLVADATQTGLPDASFDRIFAVSVIEHFPGDGDIRFVREAARLLRPGGRVIITVPASPEFREDEAVQHYHGFERRYDAAAMQERLAGPSGLRLHRLCYMCKRPNSLTARAASQLYGSLDAFYGKWYEMANNSHWEAYSIWLTRATLEIRDKANGQEVGALLSLERPA